MSRNWARRPPAAPGLSPGRSSSTRPERRTPPWPLASPSNASATSASRAHIDSGKTTLTERILFYTGRIHAIHEVSGKDGVGAKMDSMDLEREKGITIQSAATYCVWNGSQDQLQTTTSTSSTPPATSTSPSRSSARCACSTARSWCSLGARACSRQSITVDRQMRRYKVPRIAFVNKMDRPGANYERVAEHAQGEARPPPGHAPDADRRRGQVRGHRRPDHR